MPSARIQTPLGIIEARVSASGDPAAIERTNLQAIVPRLLLPKGMAVDGVEAIILIVRPGPPLENLILECVWITPRCDGSPETGERLDAQSWEHDCKIVMVGTEDYDQLHNRLPHISLPDDQNPVELLPSSLRITIPRVEAEQTLSLHFVVAYNRIPEPVECSAWFAVDICHEYLLQAIRSE